MMRDLFYGWYMKCQSDTQTLAVIPAITIHENPSGPAFYRFRKAEYTLFVFETEAASFEYEYSL